MVRMIKCRECGRKVPVAKGCKGKAVPHDAPDGVPCLGLPVSSLYPGGKVPKARKIRKATDETRSNKALHTLIWQLRQARKQRRDAPRASVAQSRHEPLPREIASHSQPQPPESLSSAPSQLPPAGHEHLTDREPGEEG